MADPAPELRMGFLQRVKAAMDPHWLLKRSRSQYMSMLLNVERERAQFKAAEMNRLNANWTATGQSINSYLQAELTTMRNRSRWLLRNMPNAISGMNAFISYCVGTGVTPISTVYDKIKKTNDDGTPYYDQVDNDILNEDLDDLWEAWAKNVDVTAPKHCPQSFYDIQELVLRKWIEDGEAFVHTIVDKSNPVVPLYLEMFEPESLDLGMTENKTTKNKVVMGVELDKRNNRPVGYWIKNADNKSVRYDADSVFHFFKVMRPGQVRGFPWLHGVMEKMFQAEQYEDSELLACKIASCMSVFIERAKGMTETGDFMPETQGGSQATDGNGNPITHVQPGMIGSFPHGAGLHVVAPQKPGATFGMFTSHIQHKAASGIEYGLSFEALTRNTSSVSYASGRLGLQRDYQGFRQILRFMQRKFYTPFRNDWMDLAVISGAVEAPGYNGITVMNRDATYYQRHEWIPPAWQYGVNPKDDVAASRDAIRAGISTLDVECGFLGRDWRTVLRMQAKVKRTADRYGLNLTSDGTYSIINGVDESEEASAIASNNVAVEA